MRMVLAVVSILALAGCASVPEPITTVRYQHALWWTGDGFESGDRDVANGRFVAPGAAIQTIDLEGAYVIPPLADGHVHGFDTPGNVAEQAPRWIGDGIRTVLSLGGPSKELAEARAALSSEPLDVRLAGAALTSPGGHPIPYYEAPAMGLNWWSASPEEKQRIRNSRLLDGDVYFALGTPEEVDRRWADIVAVSPDFIKIILFGDNGLSSEVAAAVVRRAHSVGLKVVAHVQDNGDLETALDLGVDLLAHAPDHDRIAPPIPDTLMYRDRRARDSARPDLCARTGDGAMGTASRTPGRGAAGCADGVASRSAACDARGGDRVGSRADLNDLTALDELAYWRDVGAFDGATLLRIALSGSVERWLGEEAPCLYEGCAADFLALPDDPTEDILAVRSARFRVLRGTE